METFIHPVIRVAYCDDHALIREGITSVITKRSLQLPSETIFIDIQAGDGRELLLKLETADELPDVCLIDINMPEMNGFDTVAEVRRRWPHMGIVVFTIFDLEHYIIRMIMSGANGYLIKNCKADEMINAITSVYHNGMYYPDLATMHFYNAIQNGTIGLQQITALETEMPKLVCTDLRLGEIAEKLDISVAFFEQMQQSLYRKLKINSRAGLVFFAVQAGIVPMEANTTNYITHH